MRATVSFNTLFVVESLAESALHSGTHLIEELKASAATAGAGLCLWKVRTRLEMGSALGQVLAQVESDPEKTYPFLHLDAHGASDGRGIALASGEIFPWTEFIECSRKINIACQNNLVVVANLCDGIAAIAGIDARQVTPYFALLGPASVLKAQDADSMSMFYKELMSTGDVKRSLMKLEHKLELYLAEDVLRRAFALYLQENGGKRRRDQLERVLTNVMQVPPFNRVAIRAVRRRLKRNYRPAAVAQFELAKIRFLMADHPDNAGRFASTFADVERLAERGRSKG